MAWKYYRNGKLIKECDDLPDTIEEAVIELEENDFIQQSLYSMTSEEAVWIGLTDEYEEGNWEWVTGEDVSYTNWAEGEPNNNGDTEHYGEFNIADGLWNDGRTDEDQLGVSYDDLEWAMKVCEASEDSQNLNLEQNNILQVYNKHRKSNLHKMKKIPVFKK